MFEEIDLQPIIIETHEQPVYGHNVEINSNANPWYHVIKAFVKDDSYPKSFNFADRRTPIKLACRFFLNDEILCKPHNSVLLGYIDAREVNKIMS